MSALRELLASFRIDVDVKKLEEMHNKVDEASKKFMELGELLVGGVIVEGFREFVENGIQAGAQLKIMSERLGLSTDELQKFQFAAAQSGASAEEADAGLRLLNRTIGEATNGNADAASNFQKLGISLKDASGQVRPTMDIVGDLAESMKNTTDHSKKTKIAIDAFGRGGVALVPLLADGREGVEKLGAAFDELGGGLSKDTVEAAHKAEQAQGRLNVTMLSLKSKVLAVVLPLVERAIEFFTRLSVSFKKLTDGTNVFTTGMMALGTAFAVFTLSKVWALVGGFEGLAVAFDEILLPLAAFALAYLIFDDFYTLLNGGDSIIGRFIDNMYGVGTSATAVNVLKAAWDGLWVAIKKSDEEGGFLHGTFDVIESALEGMVDVASGLYHILNGIGNYLLAIPKGLGAMSEATKKLLSDVAGDFEDLGADVSGAHVTGKKIGANLKMALAPPAPLPVAPQDDYNGSTPKYHRPGVASHGGGVKNEVTINISGNVGDTAAVANASKKGTLDGLHDHQMRNANGAVSTGM